MAAKRCSSCNLNHPLDHHKCAACGSPVWYMTEAEPDADFGAKLDALKAEAPGEGAVVMSRERIARYRGQPWIHDESLAACGYTAEIGTVIKVQGRKKIIFFELAGRLSRTTTNFGTTEYLPGWWIERVETEGWVPDAPPEA